MQTPLAASVAATLLFEVSALAQTSPSFAAEQLAERALHRRAFEAVILYGPKKELFDKTWTLLDVEHLK